MAEDPEQVTVLAVDDQPVFLRTARSLIAATPGFEQVGEAASGAEALALAADLHPDLVLVDIRMPGMDGFETARRLAGIDPDALIVLVSLEEVREPELSSDSACATAHLRKQELSTSKLRELWKTHRGPTA